MANHRHRVIAGLFKPYRLRLVGLISLTAVLSILAMLPPLLTRAVINQVIGEGRRDILPLVGAFMIVVPIVHAFASYLQVLGIAYVAQKLVMTLRHALYEHMLFLSMRFFSKHSVGKLVNRLMGDSGVVQRMLSGTTINIVSDFVCSAFAISVTFALNWRLAIPLVCMVLLFVVNYRLNIQRIRWATRSYRGAEDRLAGGVQNRLLADLTVKTFGTEGREHDAFRLQSSATLDLVQETEFANTSFSMNTQLLRDAGRLFIYFLGCALVLTDKADYGDVTAFTAYAMQLLMPAVRFSSIARQLQQVRISLDRLFEILDEKPELTIRPGARKLDRAQGGVDFNHVSFQYEEDRPVLRDIDFHVKPGETVALVGPTGCGKTSILSLLLRFFDVDRGSILLDGTDLRDIDLVSLRKQFGIVLQESLLFEVSIAENIRYARRNASLEEVRHAARVAEIDSDIASLPDGYASEIGRKEIQLSVGQKQRISIARAVLADPAILIMDEATSALDSESERAIQRAMDKFLVGRTSFIVAHRLSTTRHADKIVLLEHGRIVEMGNHDELMAIRGGRYQRLYDTHAGKGIITEEF